MLFANAVSNCRPTILDLSGKEQLQNFFLRVTNYYYNNEQVHLFLTEFSHGSEIGNKKGQNQKSSRRFLIFSSPMIRILIRLSLPKSMMNINN